MRKYSRKNSPYNFLFSLEIYALKLMRIAFDGVMQVQNVCTDISSVSEQSYVYAIHNYIYMHTHYVHTYTMYTCTVSSWAHVHRVTTV